MASARRVVCEAAFGFGPFGSVPAGTWQELVDADGPRLRAADWQFGRDSEFEHFPAGSATILLRNRDRALDPDNPSSPHAGDLLPNVPVRLRSIGPAQALNLPGTAGATASTPDHADFAVTNLDVRARLSMNDWSAGGFGVFVVAQWPNVAGNNGWQFAVSATGELILNWTANGTTAIGPRTSTVATGFADGTDHWVRATLDVDNGAAGHDVRFFTSTNGFTWTQLGSTITTAGVTSIFNSTAALAVGDILPFAGKVRQVEIQEPLGTVIAAPDFAAQVPGCTSFTDSVGKTWTVNGAASIVTDPNVDVYLDEFYGYVTGGWQQQLAPVGAGDCQIELTDLLGVTAGYTLPDVFEHAMLETNPVGCWILDADSGDQVTDLGSGRNDGIAIGEGIKLGDKVITPGDMLGARFDNDADTFGRVQVSGSQIIQPADISCTVLVVFQARSTLILRTLFFQGAGNSVGNTNANIVQLQIDEVGRLEFARVSTGGTVTYQRPGSSVVDGQGHIVFAQTNGGTNDGIALDSEMLDATTGSVNRDDANGVGIGGCLGMEIENHWDGWICVAGLWDTDLSEDDRMMIHDAHGKLDGLRSDEHITWALDYLGIPTGLRHLDQGSVHLGPADTAGKDALAWMWEVTATEGGGLYVDHRDGGKIRYTNRYHRFLSPRSTARQATFSDQGGVNVRYPAEGLDIAPNGLDGIVNQANVTWSGGEVVVQDQTSIDAYGPRPRTLETVSTTPAMARSAGEWVIARYKDPRSRIRGCTSSDRHTGARHERVEALRLDDRVRFQVQPLQTGAVTDIDLFVDGVSHSATGVEWVTSFRFAPVDTFTPWVWGVSAWGTTAIWG